ncbi:MAG: UDP-N-acetylglucosamine pyrophosphorylase [Clostridia bacterium]|nr:UDP-N-acetylglucosamine pyrophosphorylase [Clostridia bacterium]
MERDILLTSSFFENCNHTIAYNELIKYKHLWEILPHIGEIIRTIGLTLSSEEYEKYPDDVWISRGARVNSSAEIKGPCIICQGAEIRHCAFVRGNVIIGRGTVIGNSTEVKNSIIFDKVQLPHYNYVGDSIIGYGSHLGAGAIISNVRGDKSECKIKIKGEIIDTGLRKLGAFIGEGVEIGCNSVINPASVIGKDARVYPLSLVRGYVPQGTLYKSYGNIVEKR